MTHEEAAELWDIATLCPFTEDEHCVNHPESDEAYEVCNSAVAHARLLGRCFYFVFDGVQNWATSHSEVGDVFERMQAKQMERVLVERIRELETLVESGRHVSIKREPQNSGG